MLRSAAWRPSWPATNQFASKSLQRVRNVSQKNFRDMVLTNVAAVIMDSSAGLRKLLFDKVISDSRPLKEFLADPDVTCPTICNPPGCLLHMQDGRSGLREDSSGSGRRS